MLHNAFICTFPGKFVYQQKAAPNRRSQIVSLPMRDL
jgi:hypothetical protein